MNIETLTVGSLRTNCYILSEHGQCIVIDAGAEGEKISDFIEQRFLKVNYVLATHGHFDHIAAVDYLRQRFDCPFHIHKNDAYLLHSAHIMAERFTGEKMDPVPEQDAFIGDKSYILGETSLKPLLTPGHTPGSVSFLAEGKLFSGDTLFKGSIGRTDIGGSMEAMKNTVEKLKGFDNDMSVLPGHGPETTIGKEKKNNPFFTHFNW